MTSTTPSPFRPRPPKPSTTSPSPYFTTTSPSLLHTFSPAMRDRQARGKDPYRSDSDDSSSNSDGGGGGQGSSDGYDGYGNDVRRVLAGAGAGSSKMRGGTGGVGGGARYVLFLLQGGGDYADMCVARGDRLEKLDYSRVERRQKAVAFLESPELLMMWAQSQGDVSPPFFPFPLPPSPSQVLTADRAWRARDFTLRGCCAGMKSPRGARQRGRGVVAGGWRSAGDASRWGGRGWRRLRRGVGEGAGVGARRGVGRRGRRGGTGLGDKFGGS